MKKNILEVKELFNSFYSRVYKHWKIENRKAGKDIVGEEYENFRKNFYQNENVDVFVGEKVFNSSINFDIVVKKNEKILILEECKGSYVDSPFLKRCIFDFAMVVDICLENKIECPFFILSSSTKMKNFDKKYKEFTRILKDDIREILNEKFSYLPMCEHDRIKGEKYFKTPENNFILSETLIENQINKVNEIII